MAIELVDAERQFEQSTGEFSDPRTRSQEARKFLEQESKKLREYMIHLERITAREAPSDGQPT